MLSELTKTPANYSNDSGYGDLEKIYINQPDRLIIRAFTTDYQVFPGDYKFKLKFDDHGNSLSSASPISTNTTINGNFDEASDVDYFTFTATNVGVYQIVSFGSIKLVAKLRDSNGNIIAEKLASGNDTNFEFNIGLTPGEDYSLEISA